MPGRSHHTAPTAPPTQSPAATHHKHPAHSVYRGAFSLVVHTGQGNIRVAVAPLSATVGTDGAVEPIDPPHGSAQQWDTAAWIEQSAYPDRAARGPSYVYGHACHYHLCPFTQLVDARVGDAVTVQSAAHHIRYRVCSIGVSSKAGNLVLPACDSRVDLVLVTCQYELGDTSTNNLVVVATMISGRARSPR